MRILITFFLISNIVSAQSRYCKCDNTGRIYGTWGYNRSFFSNSDIHFKSDNYNITLLNVTASDRPRDFSFKNYFDFKETLVPQYIFNFGYFLTDKFHVSIGMDHLKYIVDQGQTVKASGNISPSFNSNYGGQYDNTDLRFQSPDFSFEHTNGLNIFSVEGQYLEKIYHTPDKKLRFNWNLGIGAGPVVTKTDLKFMSDGIDNDFHISGYDIHAKTGPRIEFFNNFFIEFQMKYGYVNLPDVIVENEAPKSANHHFTYFEYFGNVGLMIRMSEIKNLIGKD